MPKKTRQHRIVRKYDRHLTIEIEPAQVTVHYVQVFFPKRPSSVRWMSERLIVVTLPSWTFRRPYFFIVDADRSVPPDAGILPTERRNDMREENLSPQGCEIIRAVQFWMLTRPL